LVRITILACSNFMHGHIGVCLEPPHLLWKEATVFYHGSSKNVTVALQTAALEFKDGCVRACFRMRLVFGVAVDLGDGAAIDFDGERGGEAIHLF